MCPAAFWFRCLGLALAGLGSLSALSGSQEVVPGLVYEHRSQEGPLSIHILDVDPGQVEILAGRALNDGVGLETVSSIALRSGAVAAVNGGFFGKGGRYDGDPSGILKIGGNWFSDSKIRRGILGWTRGAEKTLIGRASTRWSLLLNGQELPVSGINRTRGSAEAVLYTWAFHRSTLTSPGGTEVLVQGGRVREVRSAGDSPIPVDGFVYSIGPRAEMPEREQWLSGAEVRPRVEFLEESGASDRWEEMDYILGGTPVLIQGGQLLADFSAERVSRSFVESRHPRTAVCTRKGGKWVLLVVDGRRPDTSIGMTLSELGRFLLALGCSDALNLDGGGSSTMFVKDRVVNTPSDIGGERAVSDAILIRQKR
jgi:hypothetical protein